MSRPPLSAITALESFAGREVSRLIGPLHRRRHHRALRRGMVDREAIRRARDSWWGADPRWYPGGTPPRRHNRVTPLIDGEAYFSALCEALRHAKDYVYATGWCLTPNIPLRRGDEDAIVSTRLLELLSSAAQRAPVRLLLWSGAPALLQPTTRRMADVQRTIERESSGNIVCRLDRSARISHCHHQKAIVVDGQVSFVGGIDLTTFQGDRWDVQRHPLRSGPNWHDVQVRIEGEAVADVENNFRQRWSATTGDHNLPHREPLYDPSWDAQAQIVRTIPHSIYPFAPRGEYGIHYAYTRALREARRFIYLENQYLWSPDIVDALITAIDKERSEPFRVVILLPARAYSGKWDNDQHVSKLREVDRGRGIVSVYCPYASGPSIGVRPFLYRPTYVHAKVAIIDDEWFTVGSANLNNRGLITDSEINAVVRQPELARSLRIDLWAEHLGLPRDGVALADPVSLVDHEWVASAERNAATVQRGDRPLASAVHRYELGRMPGLWLLEEAEALTFEH